MTVEELYLYQSMLVLIKWDQVSETLSTAGDPCQELPTHPPAVLLSNQVTHLRWDSQPWNGIMEPSFAGGSKPTVSISNEFVSYPFPPGLTQPTRVTDCPTSSRIPPPGYFPSHSHHTFPTCSSLLHCSSAWQGLPLLYLKLPLHWDVQLASHTKCLQRKILISPAKPVLFSVLPNLSNHPHPSRCSNQNHLWFLISLNPQGHCIQSPISPTAPNSFNFPCFTISIAIIPSHASPSSVAWTPTMASYLDFLLTQFPHLWLLLEPPFPTHLPGKDHTRLFFCSSNLPHLFLS